MTDKKVRRITPADRFIAYKDEFDRVIEAAPKPARRRTLIRSGKLELVVVEVTGLPTAVMISEAGDDSSPIIETTAKELIEAAEAVKKWLANPPPIKRRR